MSEALQVVNQENPSSALVPMRVEDLVRQLSLVQQVMAMVMKEGVHYGKTPGCGDKASLFKAGAEKLGFVFRLASEFAIDERSLEGGHREYRVTCRLSTIGTNVFVGSGVGTGSTQEGKYRFRTGPKTPTGRAVPKEYWDYKGSEPGKAQEALGGKGFVAAKNESGQWEVHMQGERVEHDNPPDYFNTVLKMAKKRAQVDAILTCTAASDIFSQDLEDLEETAGLLGALKPEFRDVGYQQLPTVPHGTQANGKAESAPLPPKTEAPARAAPAQDGPQGPAGAWRDFIVPKFVKKAAGRPLGSMDPGDLAWWGKNYVPKGFGNNPPSPADFAFRKALDAAIAEMEGNAGEAAEAVRRKLDQPNDKPGEDVPY
jgi:hypothetical protein